MADKLAGQTAIGTDAGIGLLAAPIAQRPVTDGARERGSSTTYGAGRRPDRRGERRVAMARGRRGSGAHLSPVPVATRSSSTAAAPAATSAKGEGVNSYDYVIVGAGSAGFVRRHGCRKTLRSGWR
jgi:hypothetical protein